MPEFKLIVAGGRDFQDNILLAEELRLAKRNLAINGFGIAIVTGMAEGADMLAKNWAERFYEPVYKFPADWDTHGKAAGPIRNKQMLDFADGLLAFWDGSSKGTKNMIDIARKAGLPTRVVRYTNN